MPNFGFGELYNKMKDDRRKKRMANEDKITSNAIETLRSDARFLVPLGVVVVGGSPYVQDGATSIRSLPTRVGSWRNVRGTGITLEEAKTTRMHDKGASQAGGPKPVRPGTHRS